MMYYNRSAAMKNIIISQIVIILLIVSFVGCLENEDYENNEDNYFEKLTIAIFSSSDSNYYVLIPIIIDGTGSQVEFVDSIEKKGNFSITIQNTRYGLAYNISAKGNIEMIMKNNIEPMYEDYFGYSLTLLHNTTDVNGFFNYNYYISSDKYSLNLEYSFLAGSKLCGRSAHFNITSPNVNKWSIGQGFGGGGCD